MDTLIVAVNKLQDIFNAVGCDSMDLPQIVVVGAQSSGKSSTLENIVGRDFLPRGQGMVTRRPLILQLVNTSKSSEWKNLLSDPTEQICSDSPLEYATFLHDESKVFTDLDQVKQEIVNETNKIAGDKHVSNEPIRLRIYSPNVISLTLVDLPGLTKIPIAGQPADIETQIFDMVMTYVKNPNSIILAVTPANTDIATSEALKLANSVDPKGLRTIACLTKLDLMDKGTSAYDILSGKLVYVKLGIIGLVNRSQLDIENNKSISDALEYERKFINDNYTLLSSWCGTDYLVKTLNKLLLNHIQKCLPELRDRIHNLSIKFTKISESLGEDVLDKKLKLLEVLTQFSTDFSELITGSSSNLKTSELYGGSRIYYIYHEVYGKTIRSIDSLDGVTTRDIQTAIRNSKGTKPSLFVPEAAFELLVKKQIQKLEAPSLNCASHVHDEIHRILNQVISSCREISRFPSLLESINEVATRILQEELIPTFTQIKHLTLCELAYINTNHPDFNNYLIAIKADSLKIGSYNEQPQEERLKNEIYEEICDKENCNGTETFNDVWSVFEERMTIHTELIQVLMKTYMSIIKNKFQDSVPKVITCFLVNKVVYRLRHELVKTLYNDSIVDDLLTESQAVRLERERSKKMLIALNKANAIITEIKEIRSL